MWEINVTELFEGLGSGWSAVTLAVEEKLPVFRGMTWTVIVAPLPGSIAPRLQVTTPPDSAQMPCEDVAFRKRPR